MNGGRLAKFWATKKLDDASRAIRRRSHQDTLDVGLQFAEDFMRLRRDRRNYQQVVSWMDRINLVRSEHSRELSLANKSLYEFLHPDEGRPAQDQYTTYLLEGLGLTDPALDRR